MREPELPLPGAMKPYAGAAAFREPTGPGGESPPTRDRASCCLFYPLRPEGACATCPGTCDADRLAKPTAATGG